MKIRLTGHRESRRVFLDDRELTPEESQKVINHSPDGFNWGYGGSGPAQLALAILLKTSGREVALRYYESFKWAYIVPLPQGNFDTIIEFRI